MEEEKATAKEMAGAEEGKKTEHEGASWVHMSPSSPDGPTSDSDWRRPDWHSEAESSGQQEAKGEGDHASPTRHDGGAEAAELAGEGGDEARPPKKAGEGCGWLAYAKGAEENGFWKCPACGVVKDEESKMRNHVWSLAGTGGHPPEAAENGWYPDWPPKKWPRYGR
jgi:hypothetical protein